MAKKLPKIVKDIKKYVPREINYAKDSMISYSQFSMYKTCPHRWSLVYKDKNKVFSDSIHTVFGTAFHETFQHYLTKAYEVAGTVADKINLEEHFQLRFIEAYQKSYKANNNQHFSSAEEMREFFDDGVAILNFVKKNRSKYFSSRGWHLVGIEIPIILTPHPQYKNVLYKGLLDLVLYNEKYNMFYIFDIKTSTKGWNDQTKKDELKQFQLIFYKQFFAKQFNILEEQINIEFFIVKRKVYEHPDFPIKRVQQFSPPSGKIKSNKAIKEMHSFIEDCFGLDGKPLQKEHPTNPGKHCLYCPFNETSLCTKSSILK